ncbi:MAG: ferric reductase-like transmembrane domain-containing protein [Azoarcus sp.]|jgi:predicted ferric reductase|nr:ferric reductase-like transmembrane domain-containing protein [Azoarcus sp.]
MKNIKLVYAVLLLSLTALWAIAEMPWAQSYDFRGLRAALINYTGIIAIGAMSVGMILALRPVSVEPLLGGLDKSYRLHKWLGITALVVGIVHWLWADVPKWAADLGWRIGGPRPVRGAPPPLDNPFLQFFREQREFAEHIGEWAFYVAVVLIALALVKRFPYRHFFNTHRLIAIAYLVLVFHAVVLIKAPYWNTPVAWFMSLLALGGVVGAVMSLARRIGHQRRALGKVEAIERIRDNNVLKVDIRLDHDRWEGHEAGQFAFVDFNDGEGPHPYTISSGWKNDGLLHFHIKELGDYTSRLEQKLKLGMPATVEGPYGCFNFESAKPHQIWIGGGIGITPFIARMEELAHRGGTQATSRHQTVELFYSTRTPDEVFIDRLRDLAQAAQVNLHVIVSGRDGKLDAGRLVREVVTWKESSLWFCGPAGFGHALKNGLGAHGFDGGDFHQELFDMR